jgi:hypothetical protein
MTRISLTSAGPIATIVLILIAGCSSIGGSADPATYQRLSCADLNSELGDTARSISQTAVTRGKVANTKVPSWLPGGSRVKSAVADRETARIERLKQRQELIIAARARKCPRALG